MVYPPIWPVWRQLLPHVLVATDSHRTLTGVEEDIGWLLHHAASYLRARGEAALARPLLERAWDLRRSLLGEDHPDALESAAGLVPVLWEVGQYERARELGEDTVARLRRVLGDEHPDTLRAARSLAVVLASLGEHDQAPRRE